MAYSSMNHPGALIITYSHFISSSFFLLSSSFSREEREGGGERRDVLLRKISILNSLIQLRQSPLLNFSIEDNF